MFCSFIPRRVRVPMMSTAAAQRGSTPDLRMATPRSTQPMTRASAAGMTKLQHSPEIVVVDKALHETGSDDRDDPSDARDQTQAPDPAEAPYRADVGY